MCLDSLLQCLVLIITEGADYNVEGVSGLSSPVLKLDNDRLLRIQKVRVCLDSVLQCLGLIMTEGGGFKC